MCYTLDYNASLESPNISSMRLELINTKIKLLEFVIDSHLQYMKYHYSSSQNLIVIKPQYVFIRWYNKKSTLFKITIKKDL